MKYSKWIGITGSVLLIIACFLPWAYYPDLCKYFNGFFSEKNIYGRPGKFLVSFTFLAMIFYLVPRIWAKRVNLFVTAILLAFSIKSFVLFSACYRGTCPEKKEGIYLLLLAPVIMVIAALFPDMKPQEKRD